MTKREVSGSEAGILDAILRDCAQIYPSDHLEWVRDSKRIHQGFDERGWGFLTLDLPELADFLLVGLKTGRLPVETDVAFGRRRSRSDHRPRFAHGLWKRIFDEEGLLLPDVDTTALFLLLTLTSVWKKAEIQCSPSRVKAAYAEYFNIESQLPRPHRMWERGYQDDDVAGSLADFALSSSDLAAADPDIALSERDMRTMLEGCQTFADMLISELGFFDPEKVTGRHGPGAVSDRRRGEDKYSFPSWSERLESLFPFDFHGTLNADHVMLDGKIHMEMSSEEGVSYLLDVPKTQKTPRLIAEEPTSNQWIQQGISDSLRDAVKVSRLGLMIDFNDQGPSQEACRAASVEGKFATIDLSSASDRISCSLVQRVFRSNPTLLGAFIASRTRYLKQDRYDDLPQLVELKKFASMGSALTFPVQTIVFAALAVGVGSYVEHRYAPRYTSGLCKQVRVFGDDIIVPSTWVEPLMAVLARVGLKVNVDKSFSTGYFRESCGLYAYRGDDVTPFRVRHPFSDADGTIRASWVQSSANAFLKGLWRVSKHMESVVFKGARVLATTVGVLSAGLPTFCRGVDPNARVRWDRATQQRMVSGVRVKPLSLRKETKLERNYLTVLSQKSYKDRSIGLSLLEAPPRRGDFFVGTDKPLRGPGLLVRTWVPEYALRG